MKVGDLVRIKTEKELLAIEGISRSGNFIYDEIIGDNILESMISCLGTLQVIESIHKGKVSRIILKESTSCLGRFNFYTRWLDTNVTTAQKVLYGESK